MSDCCAVKDVMLLACSGGSNVGQITNDAAKALDRLGQGRMSCLIGIGAQLPSFLDNAKGATVVAMIDGCPVACGRKALEKVGIEPDVYVVATDLGVQKDHDFRYGADEVARLAGEVANRIEAFSRGERPASLTGCGCMKA